jgi:hypothetical protein
MATRLPFGLIVGTGMSRSPTSPPSTSRRPGGPTAQRSVGRPGNAPVYGARVRGTDWATNLKGRSAAHAYHPPHRGRGAPPDGRRLRLQPSRARRLAAPPFPPGCSAPGADRSRGTLVASGVHPGDPTWRTPSPTAVLITGCSSGIGRATAERLAARGLTVHALTWVTSHHGAVVAGVSRPLGAMRMSVPRLGCRVIPARHGGGRAATVLTPRCAGRTAARPLRDQRLVAG